MICCAVEAASVRPAAAMVAAEAAAGVTAAAAALAAEAEADVAAVACGATVGTNGTAACCWGGTNCCCPIARPITRIKIAMIA